MFRRISLVLIGLVVLGTACLASGAHAWEILVSGGTNARVVERYSATGEDLGNFVSGGPALQWPSDISMGYYDDLFVVDYTPGAVYRYDDETGVYKDTIVTGLREPAGIAFDANDYMYVTYRYEGGFLGVVNRYDLQTGVETVFLQPGEGYMVEPNGIEVGPDANLYILAKDGENPSQGNVPSIYVFAPDGSLILKRHVPDYPGSFMTFKDGYIYWSVFWGGVVMRLPLNDIANAVPESFLSGYPDPMWCRAVEFGPDGNLYVGTLFNHRVVRFNGATGAYEVEVIYRPVVSGDYWDPSGLTFKGLPFPPRPEPARTIAEAKMAPEGRKVELTGAIVSAAFVDDFYQPIASAIEDPDRANGIRVISAASVLSGDRVAISGQAATVNGERVIDAGLGSVAVESTMGTYPDPVALNNRDSGGGAFGQQGAVADDATASPAVMSTATNNVGLLQTIYGKVTSVYFAGDLTSYYYVDDGTGLKDGSGEIGIRCRPFFALALPEQNDYVSVTGVMGVQQINGINVRFFWSTTDPVVHSTP